MDFGLSQSELFPDPVPAPQGPALPASPSSSARADLLGMTLELAVPLWVERRSSWTWNQRLVRCHEIVEIVASKGDIIQYKSKKKGESAEAFNALAEGVAMLSFVWGGVSLFGRRWETRSCHLCGALRNLTEPSDKEAPRCAGGGCEKRQAVNRQTDVYSLLRGWAYTIGGR